VIRPSRVSAQPLIQDVCDGSFGVGQGLEESRKIMEGLRSVCVDLLATLLEHCPRVKIVRFSLSLVEELNLNWAAEVRKLVGLRGRGRWSTKLPDGTSLILKP